jgi:hypothetical protein
MAAEAGAATSIAEYAKGFEKRDGFLPLHWDAGKGRLLLEARPGEELLYLVSLATGVGVLEVGLDRGMVGGEALARFERTGPRLRLVLRNVRFRSREAGEAARAVEESFAPTVAAGFEILAEEGGRVLVDATPLFLSDAMDVRGALREAQQGAYGLDTARSAIHLPATRAFPRNTEVEASLTFVSDDPGPLLRRNLVDGRWLSVRQHHSFVKLPDPGYEPRRFDPRIGVFGPSFLDYARGFDEGYEVRYAARHRLRKKDPGAALGEPVTPIVYYLDRAVPEPYRRAFREGALWWSALFERAGFRDAFRVEDMPEGMDALDARYNVVQWVHRTDAGASWGTTFIDPRTGEIIKGAVRMDSHRSLANYDLFAALRPARGKEAPAAGADAEGEAFVMARRRQHAAHEVGHTLGLAHNFAAAFDGRASVMAYPAPLLRLVDGALDLSAAYREGPGEYDAFAIRYAYTEFAPGQEEQGLEAIVREMLGKGLRFVTNPDESPTAAHPEGSPWVNGADAVEELGRMLEVRRFVVDRFDERAVRPGEPMSLLARRFAMAYRLHDGTMLAATKALGGLEFRYALRGDPLPPSRPVSPARQRRALELALDAVEPAALDVPARVQALLAPPPFGHDRDARAFVSVAAPVFDPLTAARALAHAVLGRLFSPVTMARLAAQQAANPGAPTPEEVVGRVIERTWGAPAAAGTPAALRRLAQRAAADELMRLAAHPEATPEGQAAAEWGLRRIAGRLTGGPAPTDRAAAAHRRATLSAVERFLARTEAAGPRPEPPPVPRGWALGDGGEAGCASPP